MKKVSNLNIWAQIITLPFIIVMVVLLIGSVTDYDDTDAQLDKSTIEETVAKYVVQCYASEGAYPPNLEYLADHYGLILDKERYIYQYDIFASNIMPEIIILDKNEQ